ncbi:MAG TPA: hypothetical protein V6C84_00605 [Coleofasciculaceae cyanobacterium]
MLYPSINTSRPWFTLAKQIKQSAASLALGAGFAIAGLAAFPANAETLTLAQSGFTASPESHALTDGTYLYGQSQVAEQMGSAYMVFEVNQGKLLGAFYMPRSSFDCFYGNLEADRVALTVVDSYEKSAYPYDVALETSAPVAMAGEETISAPVGLEGFQRLENLSENDQRILSTCKANYQDQI